MKTLLFILLAVFTLSCTNKISIIENQPFYSVLEEAKKNNKPVFLLIGGGRNCTPCIEFQKELRNSKLLRKYKDRFIFYSCNVNTPQHSFVHKILLPFTIPNYYLIKGDGSVLSFSFHPLDEERIDFELSSFLEGNTLHYEKHPNFPLATDSLLQMQSLLIGANLSMLAQAYQNALQQINQSIAIHPYFYNNFLKYKIYAERKDTAHIDSMARIAYQYINTESNQPVVFEEEIKELESVVPALKQQKSRIEVFHSEIDCGKIKSGSKQNYRIKFSNKGNYPLVILDVTRTCGCIRPEWSNTPIKQNDTGSITVSFQADTQGKFEQKIKIYSNAINSPNTIKLYGVIY